MWLARLLMDYAKGIREARRLAGLGQVELSVRAGFDPSYLSHLESGRKVPSLPTFEAIARAMEMSVVLLPILSYDGPQEPFEGLKSVLLRNRASGLDGKGV